MRHIIRLHALLVMLFAFAGCNLYMDEDDAPGSSNMENGDGLDTESIDVQPAGGGETIDYNDVNQSYGKFYQDNYVILE